MRSSLLASLLASAAVLAVTCCRGDDRPREARVVFLHHSTGEVVWNGGVERWLEGWNREHGVRHRITERAFPADPYPWDNYPYDYWNIWVAHAGPRAYQGNPTLELLTRDFDVVVWKHCFPVSAMEPDEGRPSVSSDARTRGNYELQYAALAEKLRAFPATKFLVWTGAALRESETDAEQAGRARAFAAWVTGTWDRPGDNIFVFDFRRLETEGGLYLLDRHATDDSHPNEAFAAAVAPRFGRRLVDVIEGRGDTGDITGR